MYSYRFFLFAGGRFSIAVIQQFFRFNRFEHRCVTWQPAGDRRKITCKVKADEDKRQSPPVAAHDAFEADRLTGFRREFFQVIIQLLVKGLVFDKHIGLEIHGKTEWVQVARSEEHTSELQSR